jgi:hypothetical protein
MVDARYAAMIVIERNQTFQSYANPDQTSRDRAANKFTAGFPVIFVVVRKVSEKMECIVNQLRL